MPSLSDKLRSLGVKIGAQDLTPSVPAPEQTPLLEQLLAGHPLRNSQGETFVVDSHYPNEYRHDRTDQPLSDTLRFLAAWAGDPALAELKQEEFAYLDTETTGLSGGTGTYAFLIGVGRFEQDQFHLAQFFMRDPSDEPAQLLALEEFLAPCKALVSFNGKAFDAPLLNTRYLVHGWRTPLLDIGHIDLLHLARRLWRNRLPSRTLGNLEVQILGSERTEEDVPGWAIPSMYFDYLRSGDPSPLKSVFYHNAMDVVSLAALFQNLATLLASPSEADIKHGVDLIALARLYEDLGEVDLAVQLYLQGLDYEDHIESTIDPEYRLPASVLLDAIARLARLHKRQENYSEAVLLWEKAAQYQHIPAYIELAKYYEHHNKNNEEALRWVLAAWEIINSNGYPSFDRNYWLSDIEPRINRLRHKLERSSSA